MQEETSNITRNFYDPMTGHTIQRDCPLYEWTPGTLSTSPSVFYEPEYIDEDSEVFGSIDGFSVPESSLVVTPYVSVIWYKDGSYPRVYGKCCVLPQRLVAKNTKVNFWDLFGEFEIDFPSPRQ